MDPISLLLITGGVLLSLSQKSKEEMEYQRLGRQLKKLPPPPAQMPPLLPGPTQTASLQVQQSPGEVVFGGSYYPQHDDQTQFQTPEQYITYAQKFGFPDRK